MKPLQPKKLKAGQALGTADGFVDSWNWAMDYLENLHGDEQYIHVDTTIPESPEIQMRPEGLADLLNGLALSGGGTSAETTLSGNVDGSTKIGGDIEISAMLSSNVSAYTFEDNGRKVLALGVYYI